MKKIIFYIGLVLFSLGVMSANTEQLAIPAVLVTAGIILMGATKEVFEDGRG